jgi:phosphoribosylformylglycinamidine (FGAM) synthase PurS component
MTNSEGETVTVMTNSSGYYRFTDVEVGQAVVISVTSKRYIYAPKVVNVGEDLVGLDFFPE